MPHEPRIAGLRRLFRLPASRRRLEGDVDDELRFHIDSRVDDLVARGQTREAAEAVAAREYGDVRASRAELVAIGRRRQLHTRIGDFGWSIAADLRYAARQIKRAPMFAAVVVLVLAIGIGANSAVFTIVRAFTMRPAPGIPHADRLARLTVLVHHGRTGRGISLHGQGISYGAFTKIRDASSVFTEVAAWQTHTKVPVDPGEEPSSASVLTVTGGYFPALRLPMARGRGFGSPEDRDADQSPVAVVSYGYWQRQLGGDSAVIGKTLRVNGVPLTIVGVTPPRFNGVEYPLDFEHLDPGSSRIDVWVPVALTAVLFPGETRRWFLEGARGRVDDGYSMLTRLRSPADAPHAMAVASTVVEQDYRLHPFCCDTSSYHTVSIGPLSAIEPGVAMSHMRDNFLLLGGIGALILLIACANVSNLLLARAVARRGEIALRLSLGAARRRVARQLLTESTVLALLGGGLGVLLTVAIASAVGARFDVPVDLSPDGVTIAITVFVAVAAGLLFGAVPALHASRASVSDALKDGVAGLDRRGSWWQGGFTVAQIALSAAFVCTTGVFVNAGIAGRSVPVGLMRTDQLLSATVDFGVEHYDTDQHDVLSRIEQRIAGLPGVTAVSVADAFPLVGGVDPENEFSTTIGPDGATSEMQSEAGQPWQVFTDPGFFAAAGLPIRRGRGFASTDVGPVMDEENGKFRLIRPGTPLVSVISEDLARRLWPGVDPIGRTLELLGGPKSTVVGVVGPVHMTIDTAKPTPVVFISRAQMGNSSASAFLIVRTAGPPEGLVAQIRHALAPIDPRLNVRNVQTFAASREAAITSILDTARGAAMLSTVALLLACVGVFAVVAFGVGQRTREIGIRIALGARTGQVVGLFIRGGLRLTLIGISVGLGLALLLIPVVVRTVGGAGFINYFAGGAFLLIMPVVIGLAIWLPARRAARVDPIIALRAE